MARVLPKWRWNLIDFWSENQWADGIIIIYSYYMSGPGRKTVQR